jgi:hypothetical protein
MTSMLYVNRARSASPEPFSVASFLDSNKNKAERAAIAAAILGSRLTVCGLTVAQIAILHPPSACTGAGVAHPAPASCASEGHDMTSWTLWREPTPKQEKWPKSTYARLI